MSDIEPQTTQSILSSVLGRLDNLERARSTPARDHLITVPGRITSPTGVTDKWDPQVPATLVELHARLDAADTSPVIFRCMRNAVEVATVTVAAGETISGPARIDPVHFAPVSHSLHFEVDDPGDSVWTVASLQARLKCREPISGAVADGGRSGFVLSAPSATAATTNDRSAPYIIWTPCVFSYAVVTIDTDIASDVSFEIWQNGASIVTVTVPAGDTYSDLSPTLTSEPMGNPGPDIVYPVCSDDGGGGYGGFNVEMVFT